MIWYEDLAAVGQRELQRELLNYSYLKHLDTCPRNLRLMMYNDQLTAGLPSKWQNSHVLVWRGLPLNSLVGVVPSTFTLLHICIMYICKSYRLSRQESWAIYLPHQGWLAVESLWFAGGFLQLGRWSLLNRQMMKSTKLGKMGWFDMICRNLNNQMILGCFPFHFE